MANNIRAFVPIEQLADGLNRPAQGLLHSTQVEASTNDKLHAVGQNFEEGTGHRGTEGWGSAGDERCDGSERRGRGGLCRATNRNSIDLCRAAPESDDRKSRRT